MGADKRRLSSKLIIPNLIEHGADINARRDTDGATALMVAVAAYNNFHNITIINELLNLGADMTIKNNNNRTALDLARELNHQYVIDNLEKFTAWSQEKTKATTSEEGGASSSEKATAPTPNKDKASCPSGECTISRKLRRTKSRRRRTTRRRR
jgi:ankyrin repeat protein